MSIKTQNYKKLKRFSVIFMHYLSVTKISKNINLKQLILLIQRVLLNLFQIEKDPELAAISSEFRQKYMG